MHIQYKEIDIEDFIWNNIRAGEISKRGLQIKPGLVYRQVELPGAGIMDLVSVSIGKIIHEHHSAKVLYVDIYELKRDAITCQNIGQIARYINSIDGNQKTLLSVLNLPSEEYSIEVNGFLVGRGVERDALHALSLCFNIRCFRFEFDLAQGIRFEEVSLGVPSVDVGAPKGIATNFYKVARASYPIRRDFRPITSENPEGHGNSDSSEFIPF